MYISYRDIQTRKSLCGYPLSCGAMYNIKQSRVYPGPMRFSITNFLGLNAVCAKYTEHDQTAGVCRIIWVGCTALDERGIQINISPNKRKLWVLIRSYLATCFQLLTSFCGEIKEKKNKTIHYLDLYIAPDKSGYQVNIFFIFP